MNFLPNQRENEIFIAFHYEVFFTIHKLYNFNFQDWKWMCVVGPLFTIKIKSYENNLIYYFFCLIFDEGVTKGRIFCFVEFHNIVK